MVLIILDSHETECLDCDDSTEFGDDATVVGKLHPEPDFSSASNMPEVSAMIKDFSESCDSEIVLQRIIKTCQDVGLLSAEGRPELDPSLRNLLPREFAERMLEKPASNMTDDACLEKLENIYACIQRHFNGYAQDLSYDDEDGD